MEKTMPLRLLGEKQGEIRFVWDGLYVHISARLDHPPEGIWKLFLPGGEGNWRLGTLLPREGGMELRRTLPLSELERAGVQKEGGASLTCTVPYQGEEPFPMAELFCFARWDGERVFYRFDGEGNPNFW